MDKQNDVLDRALTAAAGLLRDRGFCTVGEKETCVNEGLEQCELCIKSLLTYVGKRESKTAERLVKNA